MLALVEGKPEVLNLKQVLVHYINHQRDILVKRSTYELNKAKDRAHILEGLRIALQNIDNVIKIIRSSSDTNL